MREQIIMLKIGEFAQVGGVSIVTLRHYDQYGLLKPSALDPDSGYRYYSLDQLPRLNRILALKDLGFTLEQIVPLLEENLSLEQLQGMFKLKQRQIQQVIEQEQARLRRIASRLRQIEQEETMPTYDIRLKQADPLLVASIRDNIPIISEHGPLYKALLTYLEQQHVRPLQPDLLLLHSRHKLSDEGMSIDVEVAIPLSASLPGNEQITVRTLPASLMASTAHTGDDLFLGQAYAALYHWITDNGYRLIGPLRLIHHQRPTHGDPTRYVTEVQFPIVKQEA